MASAYGNVVYHWQAYVNAYVISETDMTITIRTDAYWHSIGWGYNISGCSGYAKNGDQTQSGGFYANAPTGGTVNVHIASKDVTYTKWNSAYTVTCKASATLSGGYHNGTSTASVTVDIPARKYVTHSAPFVDASDVRATYGQRVTISFDKAADQGNANFDHFELYANGARVHTASEGGAIAVTPSDVSGPRGGTVRYTLREVHEWYGAYPSTESSVEVEVLGGVVTVYDEGGASHVGLVTAYDAGGTARNVVVSVYDEGGQRRSAT